MRLAIATTATALMLAGAAGAQEISKEDAQIAFNNHCRQCHSTDEGDNRLGPNLHDIIGRKAGGAENYQYSSGLASADFTWDEATLDKWIENPDSVVSGNKMKPYPGVPEADIRKQIIVHLGGDPSKI